jgi:hypothetical protein
MGVIATHESVDIEQLVELSATEAAAFQDLEARFEAPQLPYEAEVDFRTQRLLGKAAMRDTIEAEFGKNTVTLAEALGRAAKGDKEAYNLVYANVVTDYLERAYKSGHVIRVELGKDVNGKLLQHGQTMDEVFVNSIRHLKNRTLIERARIEARNGQRIQYYYEKGLLKDNYLVMHSRVPDTITPAEAKKLGFFTETMSCAIQTVTEENGKVVVYSAFVGGADEQGKRFDGEAIKHSAATRGIDYSGLTADEILARPELVAKRDAPLGVLHFVKRYDEPTGRFFGRIHNGQKIYQAHLLECQRREKNAQKLIIQVVEQLILEAPRLNNPTAATRRLDVLNDQLLKMAIVSDESIDSNVLGSQVMDHVDKARAHYKSGNYSAMEYELRIAQAEGRSTSCPTGEIEDAENSERNKNNSTTEDCDFISKECPKCKAKNVYTKCRNGKYYGACGCVG